MIVLVLTLSKVTTSKQSNGSDPQIFQFPHTLLKFLHAVHFTSDSDSVAWLMFQPTFLLICRSLNRLGSQQKSELTSKEYNPYSFRCQFFFLLRFVWSIFVLSALQPRHFDFGCGLSPQSLAKCIMVFFHPKMQRNRLGLSFKIDREDVIYFAYVRKSRRKYGFCIGKCTI